MMSFLENINRTPSWHWDRTAVKTRCPHFLRFNQSFSACRIIHPENHYLFHRKKKTVFLCCCISLILPPSPPPAERKEKKVYVKIYGLMFQLINNLGLFSNLQKVDSATSFANKHENSIFCHIPFHLYLLNVSHFARR